MLADFAAQQHTLLVLGELAERLVVGPLLPPGLDGEVGLAVGDDRFAGVPVLDDEVAGVSGEPEVDEAPLGPRGRP